MVRFPQRSQAQRNGFALAVFASLTTLVVIAGSGTAASQVAPRNTAPPTLSGSPVEGSTLTATNGTWTGTEPLRFVYRYLRCDKDGGGCFVGGTTTQKTYRVTAADVGNTIRVRVTASNADGSQNATSAPTAIIRKAETAPPPAATGCPAGSGPIAVTSVAPPARLVIDGQSISPSPVGGSASTLTVRFHVSACGGRAVSGALVYGTAVPFQQFSETEQPTGADGWATLTMNRQSGYPASPRQQLLVVFARARKSGESLLGGISTRRLVSFPVNLSR
jgi:hypothetical protein